MITILTNYKEAQLNF